MASTSSLSSRRPRPRLRSRPHRRHLACVVLLLLIALPAAAGPMASPVDVLRLGLDAIHQTLLDAVDALFSAGRAAEKEARTVAEPVAESVAESVAEPDDEAGVDIEPGG